MGDTSPTPSSDSKIEQLQARWYETIDALSAAVDAQTKALKDYHEAFNALTTARVEASLGRALESGAGLPASSALPSPVQEHDEHGRVLPEVSGGPA